MRTNLKTYFRAILYHPQENDQEGRINPTLLNMFQTLPEIHKKQWNTQVNKMAQAHFRRATVLSSCYLTDHRVFRLNCKEAMHQEYKFASQLELQKSK